MKDTNRKATTFNSNTDSKISYSLLDSDDDNDNEYITLTKVNCCSCYDDGRCAWDICVRRLTGTLIVVSSLILLSFYVLLPLILTSYMNNINIKFNQLSMSDDITTSTTIDTSLWSSIQQQRRNPNNDTLEMYASCQMENIYLPVDIGIVVSSLNVYHHSILVGTLKPHSKEITVLSSNNGSFSLPASLKISNFTSFHNFANELLNKNNVSWFLTTDDGGRGASIRLHVPLYFWNAYFNVYVPGVRFSKTVIMKGCNGFKNTTLEMFKLDDLPNNNTWAKNTTKGLNVHVKVKIYNPSNANVTDMGIVRFDMTLKHEQQQHQRKQLNLYPKISTMAMNEMNNNNNNIDNNKDNNLDETELGFLLTDGSLSVVPGWNTLHASGKLIGQGIYADQLIEHFLSGKNNVLHAEAPNTGASSDHLFSKFVGGLSLDTTLHGLQTGIINQGAMLLDAAVIAQILNPFRGKKPIHVPTLIEIKNPFGAILNITSIHFSVIIKTSSKNQLNQTRDVVVGTASHSNVNIVVPRYNSTWIPPILLSVDLSQEFDVITGFIIDMEEKGSQNVSLIGNFSFITGGLLFNPKNYRQNDNIPCCIQDPKSERHDCP